MKKIVLIVPYFGKFPQYYQLFLNSCAVNEKFNWIIFTDDQDRYNYPDNVITYYTSFEELRKFIQTRFEFKIYLDKPQKLCDYKCAYGYIFQKYLKDADFWGHCDLDQIFGKLDHFIADDLLDKYEKVFSLGHLTLYRNTQENNCTFMKMINGSYRYKEVFQDKCGCGFDEWLPNSINDIYLNADKPVMLENIGADVNSYKTVFTLTHYNIERRQYYIDDIENSIFSWEEGTLYRIYISDRKIVKTEFPYVHLQKRKMKDAKRIEQENRYCIIPNRFVQYPDNLSRLLHSCEKWKVLNYQYFRVKWNSLKYRIKNRDWKRQNVFRK